MSSSPLLIYNGWFWHVPTFPCCLLVFPLDEHVPGALRAEGQQNQLNGGRNSSQPQHEGPTWTDTDQTELTNSTEQWCIAESFDQFSIMAYILNCKYMQVAEIEERQESFITGFVFLGYFFFFFSFQLTSAATQWKSVKLFFLPPFERWTKTN